MSNFPSSLDDDVTLPRVDDNITEIGADAINALREAVFNIEAEIGVGASGTAGSIASRLGVALDGAGNIKSSAIAGLGLVTLPITDSQISATAAIKESKLDLDYNTQDLYNFISDLNSKTSTTLAFIANTGSKVEPHLSGVNYNHVMDHIDVASSSTLYFKNKLGLLRDNSSLYTLFNDVNKDFVGHQKADGTTLAADPTSTLTGTIPPTNYAHVAAGIHITTSNFSFIPQTATDLQQFAQFIDNSNIFILGTRIQTLYSNGVSRSARANSLATSDRGQSLITFTSATTYLLDGGSSTPVDNIDTGDDVIIFTPSSTVTTNSTFDAAFTQVKPGDIATVNYGSVLVPFIIKEKKYTVSGLNKTYLIRINGKNLLATTSALVKIDKPLYNTNKYGVLASATAHPTVTIGSSYPSLILGNPRGAEVLGINFNAKLLDSSHYNLYLALYPNGNPASSSVSLAAIDVTGNQGATPGAYTLESVVEAMNNTFRKPGYNYRFIAFAYGGEIGLKLADSYNNVSFSIISGSVNTGGTYDQSLSNSLYPNNVIGLFDDKDPLGFGPSNANHASPAYVASYANADMAQLPTKLFVPLSKNNYYVNGVERERLNIEPQQEIDGYGDGYWPAFIQSKIIVPGVRVKTIYQVNRDLTSSSLKVGKTLVVQQETGGSVVDAGRYLIEDIQFNDCVCDGYNAYSLITVYDSVHTTGISPYLSAAVGTNVRLYFSGDSVAVNAQNASDTANLSLFKRHFETYINQDGYTFTHERARINISGSTQTVNGVSLYSDTALSFFNIYDVSPKLRGYSFSSVKKITLQVTSYSASTGIFSGYLCKWNGTTATNVGPTTIGKKGSVVRFYDETNVDYIDFILDLADSVPAVGSTASIDIQLFSSLRSDEEVMLLSTFQMNDTTKKIKHLRDARQFGNVSENQLSSSALDYISAPTRLLSENGIIRGFNVTAVPTGINPYPNTVYINGGTAIVNGKIVHMNNETLAIPVVQETLYPAFSTHINTIKWFVCVNDRGEFELIANTDFDTATSGSTYDAASLDHTRVFYARNPNASSPTAYPVRGTYLNDLVNNHKDVTPVAMITATISVPASTYVITSATSADLRRFIGNGYAGLDNTFVLGDNASFRSMDSLTTWLDQLTNYKSATVTPSDLGKTVIVKGNTNISSTYSLGYKSKVLFKGDSGVFTVTVGTGFTLGSNVSFQDLTVKYNYDATADGLFNDTNLINFGKSCFRMLAATTNQKNVSFKNCTFTCPYDKRFVFFSCIFSAETDRVENLVISGCNFETTVASTADYDAVIAIVTTNTTVTGVTGARLVNCTIEDNICNKNQMIAITAPFSTTIADAIVPVNVKIRGNTCGSINFCVKQDVPLSTVNSTAITDKEANISIIGNNCRYIFTGNSAGFINEDSTSNRMISKLTFFTPNIIIADNIVSWIHTGQRISTAYARTNPGLIIKHNRFSAYLATFLATYWLDSSNALPTLNYALITDKAEG